MRFSRHGLRATLLRRGPPREGGVFGGVQCRLLRGHYSRQVALEQSGDGQAQAGKDLAVDDAILVGGEGREFTLAQFKPVYLLIVHLPDDVLFDGVAPVDMQFRIRVRRSAWSRP